MFSDTPSTRAVIQIQLHPGWCNRKRFAAERPTNHGVVSQETRDVHPGSTKRRHHGYELPLKPDDTKGETSSPLSSLPMTLTAYRAAHGDGADESPKVTVAPPEYCQETQSRIRREDDVGTAPVSPSNFSRTSLCQKLQNYVVPFSSPRCYGDLGDSLFYLFRPRPAHPRQRVREVVPEQLPFMTDGTLALPKPGRGGR